MSSICMALIGSREGEKVTNEVTAMGEAAERRRKRKLAATWLLGNERPKAKARLPSDNSKENRAFSGSGRQDLNLRPLGPESSSTPLDGVAQRAMARHPVEKTEGGLGAHPTNPSHPKAEVRKMVRRWCGNSWRQRPCSSLPRSPSGCASAERPCTSCAPREGCPACES